MSACEACKVGRDDQDQEGGQVRDDGESNDNESKHVIEPRDVEILEETDMEY